MTRKLILVLVIALAMFAVNAKADVCNGLPNGPVSDTLIGSITQGPGGPDTCFIYFTYCYDCGDPVDGTGFSFYLSEVSSNCEFTLDIYERIEDYLTEYSFLVSLCPQFANMQPCGSGYKDMRISKPDCWHITNTAGIYHATTCDPLCPAFCVSTYRYCYEPESQTIMFYLVGQIPAGDATDPACGSCAYYTLPMVLPVAPGTTSNCYHICQ
jgi:hypothetical protein